MDLKRTAYNTKPQHPCKGAPQVGEGCGTSIASAGSEEVPGPGFATVWYGV